MQRRQFLASMAGAATAPLLASVPQPANGPNVILINCDDMGYGDLGCYGSRVRTPNIDSLAADGLRFTQFCSASSVCSPSRAALLTGRYPTRVGVPGVLGPDSMDGLLTSETTLADSLKMSGYRTMCVGKWHLGTQPQYLPTARGFDQYYGIPYSHDMSPRVLMQNTEVIEGSVPVDTLTRRYTEQALRFIQKDPAKPFFLYLAHNMPHIPLAASDGFRGKSPAGVYGDAVQELDWSVGRILKTLEESGLDSSTLLLFTSDNGAWYQGSVGNLRGRKGDTYEGGMRVPLLARMPGRIPAGQVTDNLATMLDLFPTIAGLCGAPMPPKPLDGVDLWPRMTGSVDNEQRQIFLYFEGWDLQCARMGPWKLHVSRDNAPPYAPAPPGGRRNLPLPKPELYNLTDDPQEGYDMAADCQDIVQDMLKQIDDLLPTFSEFVSRIWRETRNTQVEWTPSGAWPMAHVGP